MSFVLRVLAYAVVPLVMAWLGNHLAALAVTDERRRRMYRVAFTLLAIFGIAITTYVEWSSDTDHKHEVADLKGDLSTISKKMDDAELKRQVAEAYLRAKWEDSQASLAQLSQFAPAIMKLAQTSADYQKKQFETRITSNKELHQLAMDVVKRTRELANKYQRERLQDMNAPMSGEEIEALTPAQKDQRYGQERNRMLQTAYKQDSDFREMVLADAKYVADEFRRRNVPEPRNPSDPITRSIVDMMLEGHSMGPEQLLVFADYFEQRAKQIPLK